MGDGCEYVGFGGLFFFVRFSGLVIFDGGFFLLFIVRVWVL